MPSNIFANTGTNVSVVFMDKAGVNNPIFIDASKLEMKSRTERTRKLFLKMPILKRLYQLSMIPRLLMNFQYYHQLMILNQRITVSQQANILK